MQISKKQLKQIISEEMEYVSSEKNNLDTLLEGYAAGYDGNDQSVSKEALIDFLEVLEENEIPYSAFAAFMENLPEQTVANILSEVVEINEEQSMFVDVNGKKYSVRMDGKEILYVKDELGQDVRDQNVLNVIKAKVS